MVNRTLLLYAYSVLCCAEIQKADNGNDKINLHFIPRCNITVNEVILLQISASLRIKEKIKKQEIFIKKSYRNKVISK